MYEGEVQSVLRCGQCNKPFDKESTFKRHGYYCRSRRVGSTARSRSCLACAKGKARCDSRRPECSRCSTKAIQCQYPNTSKGTGPRIQQRDDAVIEQQEIPSSFVADYSVIGNRQVINTDGDTSFDSSLIQANSEFTSTGEEYLSWGDTDNDFANFLNFPANDQAFELPSSQSTSVVQHSTISTNQTLQAQHNIYCSNVQIPRSPTSNPRSFIQRPKTQTGAQRIATLILHTLKSYPLMMRRHNTLPPFIHPSSISSDIESNNMEPLTNCISLVHMIRSGVQGSRRLFWKNVGLECERLCEEHLKLDKWEILAAMQALSLYTILRLDEGETDHNNVDSLLSTTVIVMATQLMLDSNSCNPPSSISEYSLGTNWKDWIFGESKRRLSLVNQVVNMLVYFDPAALCDLQTDLLLAPLPSKKQLWEANDEFAWKAECEKDPGGQSDFGLAANGDLVKIIEGQMYCHSAVLMYKSLGAGSSGGGSADSWQEWCAGMDALGGLVMLAAALIV